MTNRVMSDVDKWLSTVEPMQSQGFGTLMAVDRLNSQTIELWLRTSTGTHIVCAIPRDGSVEVDSLTTVWAEADWREREIHEMFGVIFRRPESNEPLIIAADSVLFDKFPLRSDVLLKSRNETPWPGTKDPADESKSPSRRKLLPVGVDAEWTSERRDAL